MSEINVRTIRLTHGAGNGVDKACLMTASNMLIGKPEAGDDNSCVCPMLRTFIIGTNDAMPEEWLGEIYGPLLYEIIGTDTDDLQAILQRASAMFDFAVQQASSLVQVGCVQARMRAREYYEMIETLTTRDWRLQQKHKNMEWLTAFGHLVVCMQGLGTAAAEIVIERNNHLLDVSKVLLPIDEWTRIRESNWRKQRQLFQACAEIIRKIAAIGDKRPVECVISHEQLHDKLVDKAVCNSCQ